MFQVNEDMSIYVTRGDIAVIAVAAADEDGNPYEFQVGELIRLKVFAKKDCEELVLQKDFPVTSATETVELCLDEWDTKIGGVISKPTDYWYEVELNPSTAPQTIIGYDEDGAKLFRIYPEGKDVGKDETVDPEDIPIVDAELDPSSERPVQNGAVAREILRINAELTELKALIAELKA